MALLLLGFSPVGFADSTEREIQAIQSQMQLMNRKWNDLHVRPKTDLKSPANRASTRDELDVLADHLEYDYPVGNAALKHLLCGRPVCDGGKAGKFILE